MKIGIMGGTFDPIHNGHLIIGEYSRTSLNLDKVIFIPSGIHPFKENKNITLSNKRLDMISLAIKSNPNFELSSIEIDRKGITYTVDTILDLKKDYEKDEIYFIIGSDIPFQIEKWKDFHVLIHLVKFILFNRTGQDNEEINNKIKELESLYEIQLEKIQSPLIEISSTEIRDRVKNKLSIKYLVPESVEEYILKNNLYIGDDIDG